MSHLTPDEISRGKIGVTTYRFETVNNVVRTLVIPDVLKHKVKQIFVCLSERCFDLVSHKRLDLTLY